MAWPFLNTIEEIIDKSHPAVIADLGGGTGFILGELLRRSNTAEMKLINVDVSSKQLSLCLDKRIVTICESASLVTRRHLQVGDGALLLIARSLLHYFGKFGSRSLLRNIRSLLREGELFIHQSACFGQDSDARCLNLLYSLMGTEKWYGTEGEMTEMLQQAGLEICSSSPAPTLHLSSRDLSERYGLSPERISSIRTEVKRQHGNIPDVFSPTDDGFDAWLHYRIFVCRAI